MKYFHLACLLKDNVRKNCGISNIVQPLLAELQDLSIHPISVNNIEIYVKLVAISADN
jgi:diketogulonate reductase-like aldo/keto reductase